MTENCKSDACSSCNVECGDRKESYQEFAPLHEESTIKKVIGIVSGKGGVGKSLVTSMMAVTMNRLGYKSAILDGDITGPSIPKAFGIKEKAMGTRTGLLPVTSKTGIDLMSVNLILDNEQDPVVWRGPVIANAVKQFWSEVIWQDIDYMFIDMPPGTGDVPLTVFKDIPLDGIIIVTSPQELVSMIVAKAVKMANMMDVPIIGLVENMSYFHCPDNGIDYKIFGESHINEIAKDFNIEVLGKLPIDPLIAESVDGGRIEDFPENYLTPIGRKLEKI